jgi:hypothetical protein
MSQDLKGGGTENLNSRKGKGFEARHTDEKDREGGVFFAGPP